MSQRDIMCDVHHRAFSFDAYRFMLVNAQQKDYVISSFPQYDPSTRAKTVILRHDIDYSLQGVHEMASIEHALGISASYLFRVHAHEYNLFAPHVYHLLRELKKMGHDIGLHFEAMTFAAALKKHPKDILFQEKIILETILGEPILTASEHRDVSHNIYKTPWMHETCSLYDAGFTFYAMDPTYCKAMKYLSDSNGIWREGDLSQHLECHDRFQILVHPDWWSKDHLHLKGPYFHGFGNGDV